MTIQRASLQLQGTGYTLPLNGPAEILRQTNGIIFPFTPVITMTNSIEYSAYDLTHTNYQVNSFNKSRPGNIQVTANFSNQTRLETTYTVGVIHFLRVATKMHFGVGDNDAGTPPPVMTFSAYGNVNFTRVPVLIGGFTINYPDDVDYVSGLDPDIKLPALTIITLDLIPQYSPSRQSAFNLEAFSQGRLYNAGYI